MELFIHKVHTGFRAINSRLLHAIPVGISAPEVFNYILIIQSNPVELISEGHPIRLHVVWPSEKLYLLRARAQTLDHALKLKKLVENIQLIG